LNQRCNDLGLAHFMKQKGEKSVKWLPFLSYCSLLIVIGTVAWWLLGSVAAIINVLAVLGIFTFLPRRISIFENFWDNHILPETHIILIVLASAIVAFIVFLIAPNYKFNIQKKTR